MQPEFQAEFGSDLYPMRKQLVIKKSQRCKKCDHNLCKAEFNPSSIKFKILLSAIYHVPEIRISKPPDLKSGQEICVELTLSNLTAALMHVVLLPDAEADAEKSHGSIAKAIVPTAEFVLPVRDETSEFDDAALAEQAEQFKDDQKVVVFRRGHRIGVKITAAIAKEAKGDVWLPLVIKYDYVNTVLHLSGEAKEPQISWVHQRVRIDLGKL